ncbi:MAG: hypothetical protein LBS14_00485 [Holosporaceae bacterium]|nr:hypothetical protein [Holosporaceae bacterium]
MSMKYIVAALLCVRFSCFSMNIAMTATPDYIDYAMVAIHSMSKCTPASTDNPHRIVVFLDGTSAADRERLLCLTSPTLLIHPVDLQNPIWDGIMQQLEKIKEQGYQARHRIVSLRLLFPNIWRSGNLGRLGIPEMKEFLFLDSDLLVVKSLQPLWDECSRVDQPIIGANLWFITEDNLGRAVPLFCGGVGRISGKHLQRRPNGQISARTSGGVVFWKMDKILEIYRRRGFGDFLIRQGPGQEEEVVFDSFLSRLGDQVYFFPYTFNARPDYRQIARNLWEEYGMARNALAADPLCDGQGPNAFFVRQLQNTKGRDCSDMYTAPAIQTLESLAKGDVAVWHWDGCKYKPNDPRCTVAPGSPEEIWRQHFQEISEILAP